MVWNFIIAGLTLLAGIMIGYGLYEVIFTRRPHINEWMVRGAVLLAIPVYIYLTYRYTGKIYLTKNLNILIMVVIAIQLYAIANGYLDTRSMRRAIDNHKGDTSYLISLGEATQKHDNPWQDFQKVYTWTKKEVKALNEKRKQGKNNVRIVDGKKKKKRLIARKEQESLIPVDTGQVMNNRTLQTNTLRPRPVSTSLVPVVQGRIVGNTPVQKVPQQQQQSQTKPQERQSGRLAPNMKRTQKLQSQQLGKPQVQQQPQPQTQPQARQSGRLAPHTIERPTKPTRANQPKIYRKD